MDSLEATPYPIDVTNLNKGDTIPISQIESILGCKYGTVEYNLRMLPLRSWLQEAMADIGKPVSITQNKGSLRILLDDEASSYEKARERQFIRRWRKSIRRHASVDMSKLSDEKKRDHERQLIANSRMVQAIRNEQRKITAERIAKIKLIAVEPESEEKKTG